MLITSTSNEKIKDIKKLIAKADYRKERGLFVVEGVRMVREVPAERLQALFISESLFERESKTYAHIPEDRLFTVKDSVFEGLSATKNPQGILALVRIIEYNSYEFFEKAVLCERPFLFIIEHLQDPGNLGTIIRTAEAGGVTGVLLSSDTVDLYNPKVIRSTMGSVFRVPVLIAQDLFGEIEKIKKQHIEIFGAHLAGEPFYDKDFTGGCGFLIGNEGHGLSDRISEQADTLIRIPMKGSVESLNAAVSTAVIAYEVLRQRR